MQGHRAILVVVGLSSRNLPFWLCSQVPSVINHIVHLPWESGNYYTPSKQLHVSCIGTRTKFDETSYQNYDNFHIINLDHKIT